MESVVAMWLKQYESGAVSRRELIQGIAIAAIALTGTPASAAGFEVSAIDHIQINATHAKRSAEWYQRVLGLKPVRAGAMTDESEEIAHVGTADSLLISFRKLLPPGKVDHIGFRIDGVTPAAIANDLKARGVEYAPPDPKAAPGNYILDPDGVRIQLGGKTGMKPY